MFTCKDCVHYEICLPNSQAYGHKLKPCTKYKNKADFVEVRCKDCICYEPYNKPIEDFDGYCVARGCETDETDFCNYGEKKEGINNG